MHRANETVTTRPEKYQWYVPHGAGSIGAEPNWAKLIEKVHGEEKKYFVLGH
jgi:hypothetical protein